MNKKILFLISLYKFLEDGNRIIDPSIISIFEMGEVVIGERIYFYFINNKQIKKRMSYRSYNGETFFIKDNND